jgi:hypothetical protein
MLAYVAAKLGGDRQAQLQRRQCGGRPRCFDAPFEHANHQQIRLNGKRVRGSGGHV